MKEIKEAVKEKRVYKVEARITDSEKKALEEVCKHFGVTKTAFIKEVIWKAYDEILQEKKTKKVVRRKAKTSTKKG